MDIRPIDANALLSRCREMYDRHDNIVCAYDEISAAPILSLNTLRDEIYQDAVAHGLWMDTDGPMRCASQIDGEVQELFEEAGNVLDVRVDGGDETEVWAAYCEELADVIITGFSVAGHLGIDIDAAIRRKMEINKSRPWKHGKE